MKDIKLLPNSSFSEESNPGCKGYTSGALFNVVGISVKSQPSFSVQITQTNPVTLENAGMTVSIPTKDRSNDAINPWPYFVVYDQAKLIMTGKDSGNSCEVTVTVANGEISSFSNVTCNGGDIMNCNSNDAICFLPADF